jgi:hypothetical protein
VKSFDCIDKCFCMLIIITELVEFMLDLQGNVTGWKKIIWYVRSEIFRLIFLGENVTDQGSVSESRTVDLSVCEQSYSAVTQFAVMY